nr:MAG TPA: hypothetical protein [Caudoviricetes sp.]
MPILRVFPAHVRQFCHIQERFIYGIIRFDHCGDTITSLQFLKHWTTAQPDRMIFWKLKPFYQTPGIGALHALGKRTPKERMTDVCVNGLFVLIVIVDALITVLHCSAHILIVALLGKNHDAIMMRLEMVQLINGHDVRNIVSVGFSLKDRLAVLFGDMRGITIHHLFRIPSRQCFDGAGYRVPLQFIKCVLTDVRRFLLFRNPQNGTQDQPIINANAPDAVSSVFVEFDHDCLTGKIYRGRISGLPLGKAVYTQKG